MFPVAWTLMERRTTECYVDVLRELLREVPRLQPPVILGDYEPAIRAAVPAVFLHSSFQGCNTHYNRVIIVNSFFHFEISIKKLLFDLNNVLITLIVIVISYMINITYTNISE